jgi:hypothetical protein
VQLTDRNEVESLIKKLHPIDPGIELIRLGPEGDGGYLIPNDLKEIEACFSPGVGKISTFEKDCADLGMDVFLADFSVDKPGTEDHRFNFTKKYLGAFNCENFMTMDYWRDSNCHSVKTDLLLQIDIEGFEYEVIFNISDRLMQQFRIIVGEFHMLDQLFNKPFYNIVSRAFHKILYTHTCVHIHPNNYSKTYKVFDLEIPKAMEFTFLRNDRFKNHSYSKVFPHPLDFDTTSNPSVTLPKCWYRN